MLNRKQMDLEDDICTEIANYIEDRGHSPRFILLDSRSFRLYGRTKFQNIFGDFEIVEVIKDNFIMVA